MAANYTRNGYTLTDEQQAVLDGNSAVHNVPSSPYQYLENGLAYDTNNADSYIDAYNQAQAWARDDAIRKEGYQREDSYWSRQFADMQKAGLNPAVVLSGLSGSNYSGISSASTFKSSSVEDARHKKVQEQLTALGNGAKIVGTIAAIIGAIAAFA